MNLNETTPTDDAVRRALAADRASLPQPLWPLIRDRLPRRMRRASPRVRLAFALGSIAAALAGLILGAEFGSKYGLSSGAPTATWSEVGSVLADGNAATLGDVYFAVAADETQGTR